MRNRTPKLHYNALITPLEGEPYRKIACGLESETAPRTEDREAFTCQRCRRSPLFDPMLYRGRY